MEIGLSIFLGVPGLLLLAFGALIIVKRSQPWVQLDRGLPPVLRSWAALIVGSISLLLGLGFLLLASLLGGFWE